jgi:hypothetical protein
MIWIALSLVTLFSACLAWLCFEQREQIGRLERTIIRLHDLNQGLSEDVMALRVSQKAAKAKSIPSIVTFDKDDLNG